MNRQDFDFINDKVYNRQLIYFDNAATTQKPRQVIDTLTEAYLHYNANIHRGVHHLSQLATARHEDARLKAAQYLGAQSPKEILFTKGTTDSINMLAFSFGESYIHTGDEIIVGLSEHHSNIVPWQMMCERKGAKLKVITLNDHLTLDTEAFERLLTDRTRLVSVAQVSNALGVIQPVEKIISIAHSHNIPVCIDGAQSAARLQVDVQRLDCDFFVCSAHKMYGPTGIGLLYGKQHWLQQLPPAEGGGEMIDHVSFEHTTYNELPYKFEAGTPDFIGSVAFAKALQYIDAIGRAKIEQYENALTEYAENRLSEVEGIHIYAQSEQKAGVISFNAYRKDGSIIHPFDVGTLLDKQGVAVRTGHHCAEPLMNYLSIPGTVRISFAVYNTKDEIDTFISALQIALSMLS